MRFAAVAVSASSLVLSACEGGGDPVQQALRDASAERHAATVRVYDEDVAPGRVSQTPPATPDHIFVRAMILRHEGARDSAQAALARSTDPEIRRMAEATIESRTREIAELQAWKPANPPAE